MANKYLHIGIAWGGPPKTATIAALIETPTVCDDWFKYGGNNWLVYTAFTQSAWAAYLKVHLGPKDSMVIYEVTNLNYSDGMLPSKMWEWFNRIRF
jgi:hypothetical protein